MADPIALATHKSHTISGQAAGVDAFLQDLGSPSAAVIQFEREAFEQKRKEELKKTEEAKLLAEEEKLRVEEKRAEELRKAFEEKLKVEPKAQPIEKTEVIVNHAKTVQAAKKPVEEQPEQLKKLTWGNKLDNFLEKASNPCGDRLLDTNCGDWKIEIKKKDETRDVEVNEVEENDNVETEREAADESPMERELFGDEGIKVTAVDDTADDVVEDGIQVTEAEAPIEEAEVPLEDVKDTDETADTKKEAETSWVDKIYTNMCTPISCLTNGTPDNTPTEPEEDANVIRVSNLTEMALNGDHEDAAVVKEVMGHVKQIEHDKEFSIVEDAKKLVSPAKSAIGSIIDGFKSAWSFMSQKFATSTKNCTDDKVDAAEEKSVKTETEAQTVAKTVKTEAPTVAKTIKTEVVSTKDDVLPEESVVIPDDITAPGVIQNVSSLQEESTS